MYSDFCIFIIIFIEGIFVIFLFAWDARIVKIDAWLLSVRVADALSCRP
ncbi:MAG: hypothetical protein ACTSWN_10515 [Promethearchaeota archaeon]